MNEREIMEQRIGEMLTEVAMEADDFVGPRSAIRLFGIVAAEKANEVGEESGENLLGAFAAGVEYRFKELDAAKEAMIDSDYLQRILRNMAVDGDDPDREGLWLWLASRLNQSYPDGDVDLATLLELAKEVDARSYTQKFKNVEAELRQFWSSLR